MSLLFHLLVYLFYLAALAGVLIMVSTSMQNAWSSERARLQNAILDRFGLSDSEKDCEEACDRILALVPCQADELDGALASLAGEKHVWLCFLRDRVFVLPTRGAEVVEMPYPELSGLYLLDKGKGDGHGIAIEAGGEKSLLTVERVDDVVRIVNVLVQQNIILGYHSRES